MEGPVKSMSRTPTLKPLRYNVRASCSVIEDLPTPTSQYKKLEDTRIPPLPLRTRMVCLIFEYVFVPFWSAIKNEKGGV
jgi:hypothetical protein